MSFVADAYPRQIDVLTHISPFWRTYESNDTNFEIQGKKRLSIFFVLTSQALSSVVCPLLPPNILMAFWTNVRAWAFLLLNTALVPFSAPLTLMFMFHFFIIS